MTNRFEKTLLIQSLTISILLHICILFGAILLPKAPLSSSRPIEIQILSQNENKANAKKIVTNPDPTKLEEAIKDLKEKTDFLSQITQRVKKQQVAKENGPTKNGGGVAAAQQTQKQSRKNSDIRELAKTDLADDAPSISKQIDLSQTNSANRMQKSNIGRGLAIGDSSLAEYIPEVAEGGFTALNTDQYVYYTFFARINEQVRSRWINNIRYAIQKEFTRADMAKLSKKEQVSQVEILLSREGQFISAIVHREAEDEVLDNAATFAFRSAAPFLNPPVELVEDDGLIHLHYQFHVRFQARYYADDSRR